MENTTLQVISIGRNKTTTAVAESLAEMLKKNTTLRGLNFNAGSQKMGDQGAIALAEALEVNKTLRTISLTKHNIKDPGAVNFGRMLGKNKSLTTAEYAHLCILLGSVY